MKRNWWGGRAGGGKGLGGVRRGWGRVVRTVMPVMSVAFPETCWATGEAVARENLGLSDAARGRIARGVIWPYCRLCGLTLGPGADVEGPCGRCAQRSMGVARVVRVGTFEEPLAELVKILKFRGHWELARLMGPFLRQALELGTQRPDGSSAAIDALVPVALHWRRRWVRGFNQAEELARETGRLGGWPVFDTLRRIRPTMEQSHTFSAAQRRENLRGAFVARPEKKLAGKWVWLVDDVTTTGATLQAAAVALRRLPKEYRPAAVGAVVVCVTDRVGVPEAAG